MQLELGCAIAGAKGENAVWQAWLALLDKKACAVECVQGLPGSGGLIMLPLAALDKQGLSAANWGVAKW